MEENLRSKATNNEMFSYLYTRQCRRRFLKMKINKNFQSQTLEYYLSLKYPISLYPEADGSYTATIPDLLGCITQGETLEETIDHINEARQLWIETVYNSGKRGIPLPRTITSNVFIKEVIE